MKYDWGKDINWKGIEVAQATDDEAGICIEERKNLGNI